MASEYIPNLRLTIGQVTYDRSGGGSVEVIVEPAQAQAAVVQHLWNNRRTGVIRIDRGPVDRHHDRALLLLRLGPDYVEVRPREWDPVSFDQAAVGQWVHSTQVVMGTSPEVYDSIMEQSGGRRLGRRQR